MVKTPDRGQVFWLDFIPQVGHEQAGRRPALILSPTSYNRKSGLCMACPITSRVKGYPFEVPVPPGLAVSGVVLSDQARSLDWRGRNATYVCDLPDDVLAKVVQNIEDLIDP